VRNRFYILLLLLAMSIPLRGFGQSPTAAFSVVDKSANSTITNGSGAIAVGYARIVPSSGNTNPSGVAIFGYTPSTVLVSEAGVPASPQIKNGRIYAEVGPNGSNGQGTDIGMAIANPGPAPAVISFSYTNSSGTDVGSGTYTLNAGTQFASFLDQSPWNVPLNFQGTFTFTSTVGISVIALQLNNNTRGESLITTLPVIDTTITPSTTAAVLSHFVDASGYTTSVLLVNPTDTPMSGTIQFRDDNGTIVTLTANGQSASSFSYTIPRRSSYKLQTAGVGNLQSGSVTISPAAGSNTPVSLAVFSYANGPVTTSQAGVPSMLGTSFRMYVEATPGLGAIGSYSTGFAVANASSAAASITFDLFTADGSPTTFSYTKSIPPFGHISKFLSDIFPTLAFPFQGVLRVRTTTPSISVVALRIRFNQRGEFLMTTTPPTEENGTAPPGELDFPDILNGGGFTTQFILFSGLNGQVTSGNLQFYTSGGATFPLTLNSTINAAPITLTSIAPTTAAQGAAVMLTGSGFTGSTTVVFTTSAGAATVTPSAQTSTTLTATVPSNAITGPVFVQNGASSSSTVILQVTAAGGAQIQTAVSVGAGANATGADIYVPAPSTSLAIQGIGIGAPGGSIGTSINSITVTRGAAAQQMLIVGTGLTASTTVSVSGGNVTLSSSQFQSGGIFINITADASATPGYRNVTITNGSDVSVMTGGLLIQ
jgi:hypothetical protein